MDRANLAEIAAARSVSENKKNWHASDVPRSVYAKAEIIRRTHKKKDRIFAKKRKDTVPFIGLNTQYKPPTLVSLQRSKRRRRK